MARAEEATARMKEAEGRAEEVTARMKEAVEWAEEATTRAKSAEEQLESIASLISSPSAKGAGGGGGCGGGGGVVDNGKSRKRNFRDANLEIPKRLLLFSFGAAELADLATVLRMYVSQKNKTVRAGATSSSRAIGRWRTRIPNRRWDSSSAARKRCIRRSTTTC